MKSGNGLVQDIKGFGLTNVDSTCHGSVNLDRDVEVGNNVDETKETISDSHMDTVQNHKPRDNKKASTGDKIFKSHSDPNLASPYDDTLKSTKSMKKEENKKGRLAMKIRSKSYDSAIDYGGQWKGKLSMRKFKELASTKHLRVKKKTISIQKSNKENETSQGGSRNSCGGPIRVNRKIGEEELSQLEEFGESIGLIWECRRKTAGRAVAIQETREERAGIGMGKVGKVDWIRELCIKEKPVVVGIQETKSRNMDMKMVNNIWGSDDVDYVKKDADGRSGGILLMWDNKVFNKDQVISEPGFVAVLGRWIGVSDMVGFVNVYGPRNESDRKALWHRISTVIGIVNACWCIFGDFNEVRRMDERMNTEFSTRGALEFNDFIRRENLIDVPLGANREHRTTIKNHLQTSNNPWFDLQE
ncbi:RNA-directed DNA polymerase, eukaryota [Artemisia annua]|uniref:RNA-directed DNA polymerase, eukaryota n=1 Tax=Artemisia annua TaxID=35608 RepID=A0A2U1NJ11_ARTAN|nr:RNA-directed DNA polymerase, eukaryota [Artemisia annua]